MGELGRWRHLSVSIIHISNAPVTCNLQLFSITFSTLASIHVSMKTTWSDYRDRFLFGTPMSRHTSYVHIISLSWIIDSEILHQERYQALFNMLPWASRLRDHTVTHSWKAMWFSSLIRQLNRPPGEIWTWCPYSKDALELEVYLTMMLVQPSTIHFKWEFRISPSYLIVIVMSSW